MPGITGSPGLLASVVLTLVIITLISEVLGSVGEFKRWPLVGACLVVGAAAAFLGRKPPAIGQRRMPSLDTLVAAGTAVVVFARWSIGSGTALRSGIIGVDSLQYHLPFAATFAQSGWLSRLHYAWLDPVWTFYPYGSELFHAIGIEAFGRDVISPVVNLGWLSLAMLAAWCSGRRWGAAPLTLATACVVLSLPVLTASQPGSADNDIVSLALILSAVALLLEIGDTSGGYLLAAMPAGLAAGTTLAALPAIGGLAAGVLLFDRRAVPGKFRLGLLGVVIPGGYWYLRNLIRIGNPVPGVKTGLPAPPFPAVSRYGYSVAHYLPHGWFWKDYVRSGLHDAFGSAWPVVLLVALVGVAAPFLMRADRLLRAIGFGAVVAAAVYVVTPTSAYGPTNYPFLFSANLRFVLPSVLLFFLLAALLLSRFTPRFIHERYEGVRQTLWVGGAAVLTLVTLFYPDAYKPWKNHPKLAVIGGAAALLVLVLMLASRMAVRALAGAAILLTPVVAGLPVAHNYLAHRYVSGGPVYQWARNVSGAKIGIVAFALQYPLFGLDLKNQVSYVGTKGVHGSLVLARTCAQWRNELHRGGYDYVVIGDNDWSLAPIPEGGWTRSDPSAKPVVISPDPGARATVYQLTARGATAAGC